MRLPALLAMCLLSVSCAKKPPSPAQLALGVFAEALARGNTPGSHAAVAGGSTFTYDTTGGELVDGSVRVFAGSTLGVYDWSNMVVEKESVLPNGARRLEAQVSVCYRAEEQNRCGSPNIYLLTAELRDEDGVWKVASSTVAVRQLNQ